MEIAINTGTIIKRRRLSLNMRMEDVSKKANITRATLWSIEKGTGNYSFASLIKVLNILGLSISIDNSISISKRNRASRKNTLIDKKINRFVVMCIEQYALRKKQNSSSVYKKLKDLGIIDELINDYEDLHGMSTIYINELIDSLLEEK